MRTSDDGSYVADLRMCGNLAATEIQAAAVNLEKLVKGVEKKTPSATELNLKSSELETAFNQALESAQSLLFSQNTSLNFTVQVACDNSLYTFGPDCLEHERKLLTKHFGAADLTVDVFHLQPGHRIISGNTGDRHKSIPVGVIGFNRFAAFSGTIAVAAPQRRFKGQASDARAGLQPVGNSGNNEFRLTIGAIQA